MKCSLSTLLITILLAGGFSLAIVSGPIAAVMLPDTPWPLQMAGYGMVAMVFGFFCMCVGTAWKGKL